MVTPARISQSRRHRRIPPRLTSALAAELDTMACLCFCLHGPCVPCDKLAAPQIGGAWLCLAVKQGCRTGRSPSAACQRITHQKRHVFPPSIYIYIYRPLARAHSIHDTHSSRKSPGTLQTLSMSLKCHLHYIQVTGH